MLAFKQPPVAQSLLCGRAGASQMLVLKLPPAIQSPLCGRAGASASVSIQTASCGTIPTLW